MPWRRRGDGEQEHTLFLHDGYIFPPKMTATASVSTRSRRCKNGYRNVSGSLVAPNPRVVSKIRGKTGISLVCPAQRRMASGRTTQPGQRGCGAGGKLPRRRGLVETATREDYLPRPVRVRTTRYPKPNRKRPHLSLSLSFNQNFVSRVKVSCPAPSIVSRPF